MITAELIERLATVADDFAEAQEEAVCLASCQPSRRLVARTGALVTELQWCVERLRVLDGAADLHDLAAHQRAEARAIEINRQRACEAAMIESRKREAEQARRRGLVAFFRESFAGR